MRPTSWSGLADGGEPVPRDGSGPVAEVYPAFALIQWGLAPQETYKGKDASGARAKILEGLETGLDLDLTDAVRARCRASDHDLDALIAAATARAAACGITEPPGTDEQRAMAAVEVGFTFHDATRTLLTSGAARRTDPWDGTAIGCTPQCHCGLSPSCR